MRKQTSISLQDIRRVAITCAHCGAETTIDLSAKVEFSLERKQFAPSHCGVCRQPYDSAVQSLNKFYPAYQALLNANLGSGLRFIADSEIE